MRNINGSFIGAWQSQHKMVSRGEERDFVGTGKQAPIIPDSNC